MRARRRRGIRILADYLTILGFLQKLGDRYELTGDTKVFLDRKSPAYLGGAIAFILAQYEGELPEADGGGAARRHSGFRRGDGLPRQPNLG